MSKKRKRKTIIHVNQHNIKKNIHLPDSEKVPVLTVKTYKDNRYAMQAIIRDADGNEVARVVYADGVNVKPLSCGARVWIQSTYDIELVGESSSDLPVCVVE